VAAVLRPLAAAHHAHHQVHDGHERCGDADGVDELVALLHRGDVAVVFQQRRLRVSGRFACGVSSGSARVLLLL
jgi:hypothetical protein